MKLTETQFRKYLDKLKQTIIAGDPFEKDLEALYIRLQKARQNALILRAYRFLQLCLPASARQKLFHPVLVQALYDSNQLKKAQQMERAIHDDNRPLRPYTPLASLSKYAARKPRRETDDAHIPLPKAWQTGMEKLTGNGLLQCGWAEKRAQLQKTPAAYRTILLRDFDELVLNYLFGNHKAVIILSGSVLETLLIYRLKKQKVRQINVKKPGHLVSKQPLDANLNDLLAAADQHGLLPPGQLKLSRAARIYRNLVHPGRELSEKVTVNANKAEICFLCVLETADSLL